MVHSPNNFENYKWKSLLLITISTAQNVIKHAREINRLALLGCQMLVDYQIIFIGATIAGNSWP